VAEIHEPSAVAAVEFGQHRDGPAEMDQARKR
jgi:hypothetical protein